MAEEKGKGVDRTKREQARRNLSNEFEKLQANLKPVGEAFEKVKKAKFDDDVAALLAALEGAGKRTIHGSLFKEGIGPYRRAREEWMKVKEPEPVPA